MGQSWNYAKASVFEFKNTEAFHEYVQLNAAEFTGLSDTEIVVGIMRGFVELSEKLVVNCFHFVNLFLLIE